MAINKNFIVRNGIEFYKNLIYADGVIDRVGIGTTNPETALHVRGTTTSDNVNINNQLTIDGTIRVGNSIGVNNQYLISTGAGVTWSSLPGLRNSTTFTANEGETTFNFDYNEEVGVDVYINGVRLSPSEYVANDGSTIILNVPTFDGDTIDVVAYAVAALAVNSESLSVSGIVTASGGFLSSGNNPVRISVSGSQLIFNVVGVGSTSFTLS